MTTTCLIAYLPNYRGSFATWATKIDFTKMTHLNLAFALADGSNQWNMGGPSDSEVKALVDAAHAAGVKVLASLGGGGGDQSVIARYRTASNIDPLVANLDAFVTKHHFDGVDIDIEDGSNLGKNYSIFVNAVARTLRPKGKLVTAAVAQYLQAGMSDTTLRQFDFLNVMIYSSYSDTVAQMAYYANTKGIAKSRLVLGAAFFGYDDQWNYYAYNEIVGADPEAWTKDQTTVRGQTVNYTGVATMKSLAEYSKGFGGIMFWELGQDAPGQASLYKALQDTM